MRLLAILLTVALATSAGCFGKDDEPSSTPTPATGTTPTPATGATPSTPAPAGGGAGNNSTTPTKPAPREVFAGTATFAPSPGVPDLADPTSALGPPVQNPFTVPTGFTTLTLDVTWANTQPVAVVTTLEVSILDAAGTAIAICSVPQGAVQGTPAPCTQSATIPATGGDFIAQYHGSAPASTVSAAVKVIAS